MQAENFSVNKCFGNQLKVKCFENTTSETFNFTVKIAAELLLASISTSVLVKVFMTVIFLISLYLR